MTRTTAKRSNEANSVRMDKKKVQKVSASNDWRDRMKLARRELPEGIGQQDVLEYLAINYPALDRLTFATRWKNAWGSKVADPEITQVVEAAADHFKKEKGSVSKRLLRQKLSVPKQ